MTKEKNASLELEKAGEEGIQELKNALEAAERYLRKARQILWKREQADKIDGLNSNQEDQGDGSRVIEGVFDGRLMLDKEGKKYPVNENYASKSKLVAGDVLKLTVLGDGSFIYKQIGPTERTKLIGILCKDEDCFWVRVGKKQYRILSASVTYFKAAEGDKITIIIPKDEASEWAAVENRL